MSADAQAALAAASPIATRRSAARAAPVAPAADTAQSQPTPSRRWD